MISPPAELPKPGIPAAALKKRAGWIMAQWADGKVRKGSKDAITRMLERIQTRWEAVRYLEWPSGPQLPTLPADDSRLPENVAANLGAYARALEAQLPPVFLEWDEARQLPRRK